MIINSHNCGSYNIYTIKTDRFKNCHMEIIFRNNFKSEDTTKRTFLFDLLSETSNKYKTKRDLLLKCEELYNASCYTVSSRVGAQVMDTVVLDFLNPKYTKDKYLSEVLKLPFDLIFDPDVKNEEFSSIPFNYELKNAEICINSVKENPRGYSILQALKTMDENSFSSKEITGNLEDLAKITPANLYEYYKECLKHDYIDIYVIGDLDMDKVVDYINKYAKFDTIKSHELKLFFENAQTKKVKEASENLPITQSQLTLTYNCVDLTPEERKYAFQVYNMILGGGSLETKLYKHLREENSLCYNVSSMYQKYENTLVINTAIDKSNYDIAVKLIKQSVKEMANGDFEEASIDNAVSSIIASINAGLDSESRIVDVELFKRIAELDDYETRLTEYKKVTKEDIVKVAKKVKLNTIFLLGDGVNNE